MQKKRERVETCQVSIKAKLWTKTKVLEHLEEHEEDGQDEEVGYKGAHPPGGGQVGVVHHVDPILQPNGAIIVLWKIKKNVTDLSKRYHSGPWPCAGK